MKYRVEWLAINGEWQDSCLRFWLRRQAVRMAEQRGDAMQPWRVVDWRSRVIHTANASVRVGAAAPYPARGVGQSEMCTCCGRDRNPKTLFGGVCPACRHGPPRCSDCMHRVEPHDAPVCVDCNEWSNYEPNSPICVKPTEHTPTPNAPRDLRGHKPAPVAKRKMTPGAGPTSGRSDRGEVAPAPTLPDASTPTP
jgi:hypothetical protein